VRTVFFLVGKQVAKPRLRVARLERHHPVLTRCVCAKCPLWSGSLVARLGALLCVMMGTPMSLTLTHVCCAVFSQTRGGGNDTPAPEQDLVVDVSSRRVVFVDDEPANCRLGLRMLSKLGIPRENITVLANGAWRRAASSRCIFFRMLEDARNGIHRLLSRLSMLWLAPKFLVNLHGCATVVVLACLGSFNFVSQAWRRLSTFSAVGQRM
jgi:hypothetical protein